MKITASELKELGIIDRMIPEEEPANLDTLPMIIEKLKQSMTEFFETWFDRDTEDIVNNRYDRFRKF